MTTPTNPFAAPEPGRAQQQDGASQPPPVGYGPSAPPPAGYPPTPGFAQPPYASPGGYGPPPLPGQPPMPPYGYPLAPKTDGTAIAVLVLAISSFVVLPVIPAVVALVLAPGAERDIAAAGGRLTGEGLLRAGRIVAWVHLGLCLAFVVVLLAVFGIFGAALAV